MINDSSHTAFMDNHDSVTHPDDFRKFGRNHDDGHALGGQFIHQIINILLRADIDASCRFVEDQKFGVHAYPLGNDDLLLIAARECACCQINALCFNPQTMGKFFGKIPFSFGIDDMALGQSFFTGKRNILSD